MNHLFSLSLPDAPWRGGLFFGDCDIDDHKLEKLSAYNPSFAGHNTCISKFCMDMACLKVSFHEAASSDVRLLALWWFLLLINRV